jgi:fructosamine-3-kinase
MADGALKRPGGERKGEPHSLLRPHIVRQVERAASAHLGRPWLSSRFTDLSDRAAHPAGIFHGPSLSVFAKLSAAADGRDQFTAELAGLDLLRRRAHVAVPTPIACGIVEVEHGTLLLFEALTERRAHARSGADLRSIGHTLATLHQVRAERFGLDLGDGFFGPLRQDNRPVPSNTWADFYAQRRVTPMLRAATDSGNLPPDLAAKVDRLARRLPELCGSEPVPSLLHGDAQQNNFIATGSGTVVIDAAPYFGHPEIDLALLDYFAPVPGDVLDAYRDAAPLDPGFTDRRELWRVFSYLAVIAVDGQGSFGRQFIERLADAVRRY